MNKKTIIIASSLGGLVALIGLVVLVIFLMGRVPDDEFKITSVIDKGTQTTKYSGSINGLKIKNEKPDSEAYMFCFNLSRFVDSYADKALVTNYTKFFDGNITLTRYGKKFVYDGTQETYDKNNFEIYKLNQENGGLKSVTSSLSGKLVPTITNVASFVAARDSIV